MSGQDIYFVQVEGSDMHDIQKAANSLSGFMDDPDATTVLVPETVKPLNREEAMEYLESMANALDMELSDK